MEAEKISVIYMLRDIAKSEYNAESVSSIMNGLNKLISYMIREKIEDPPTNMSELFEMLYTRPVHSYLSSIESNEPFILRSGEINEEIREHIEEDDAEEQVQRNTMRRILNLCRQKKSSKDDNYDWQKVYEQSRTLTSMLEKAELDRWLLKHFPEEVAQIIRKMYVPEHNIRGSYKACPVCGMPLPEEHIVECRNDVCNYYIQKEKLRAIEKQPLTKLVKLHQGVYRYIFSPNIGEMKIYHKIQEQFKNCKVELYPNIDEYDIKISNGMKTVYLDVKDTTRPTKLLKLLKEDSNLDKLIKKEGRNVFLVIPDHREKLYRLRENRRYVQELNNLLSNENIFIEVLKERNLIQKLEEVLNS